jgi:hypothetical protein
MRNFFSNRSVFSQKGMAAILVVVVVSAAALLISYNSSILGLDELDSGYTFQKGEEAFSASDGCIEEALQRLKLDPNYTGENLNLSGRTCIITVSGNGNTRTISSTGTVNKFNRKIEVTITLIANVITVDGWKEISF